MMDRDWFNFLSKTPILGEDEFHKAERFMLLIEEVYKKIDIGNSFESVFLKYFLHLSWLQSLFT